MYKKVLLKVSGEVFMNDDGGPFDHAKYEKVAKTIASFKQEHDVELAVVVGAGNIWRFRDNQESNMPRVESDKMGMLATNFNAKNLEFHLLQNDQYAVAMTAFGAENVPGYHSEWAATVMNDGGVVVLGGGTGNPYFTTDSAAALRAIELQCDVIMKATKVDGVYSDDPNTNPDAERYSKLTFARALEEQLKVMDMAAFSLCQENDMPILVFDFTNPENLEKVYKDHSLGTIVTN
jgi:uridylate kinase